MTLWTNVLRDVNKYTKQAAQSGKCENYSACRPRYCESEHERVSGKTSVCVELVGPIRAVNLHRLWSY